MSASRFASHAYAFRVGLSLADRSYELVPSAADGPQEVPPPPAPVAEDPTQRSESPATEPVEGKPRYITPIF
jgi:hypothetical protein